MRLFEAYYGLNVSRLLVVGVGLQDVALFVICSLGLSILVVVCLG